MNAQVSGLSDDDRRPPSNELLEIAQRGLALKPKRLPSWLFYDERGSALFDEICEQPEYYLTRSEIALMDEHAGNIADTLGSDVRLVEYGSGNARKTSMLLQHLHEPVAYVPVEISAEPLRESVERLGAEFPSLPVQPLCADFTKPLRLPIPPRAPRRTVVYFPGSTIGNFDNRDAAVLLRKMRNEMGDAGGILIGVDLKKDHAVIEAAYNDRAGVTSRFTLNMLTRLNRDIGSNFDLTAFRHRAHYNPMAGRIETHIVSAKSQQVKIGRANVAFREDEAIQVEYSCKYSLADFEALAAKAGLAVLRVWTDAQQMFSVQYLVRASTVAR
ncbi:L-histidine N(alpha)-methyltransferase [Rhodanobacter sp. MP1X3]|jgi:dimethylhistidine N-methyltransferase|uniref:L-histidine N(alpha)-methyltransferase n=1 Tax=Rhodanobacter sp. MP1X3 TaxID=2723086 RepID=UPI001607267F|nr:L-histidine N(alpha)-methyltransferase [Rhodanobacter sp. MP1X3]MBB6242191.1 dimethylhistidine N-methyltransferase [Rhodanobacter sp. MP1X3]